MNPYAQYRSVKSSPHAKTAINSGLPHIFVAANCSTQRPFPALTGNSQLATENS